MKILFVTYSFNDFDHMAPLIWKVCKKKNSVIILNANPKFTIQNDEKFKYLNRKFKIKLYQLNKIQKLPFFFYDTSF